MLAHSHRDPKSGAVRQLVVHAFSSPDELAGILADGAWKRFGETLAWRNPDLSWDWPRLRSDLEAALRAWQETPSGETFRRARVVGRLAFELDEALRPLTPARPADELILETARDALEHVAQSIARVLAPSRPNPAPTDPRKEPTSMETQPSGTPLIHMADEIFERGMEHWWRHERAAACRLFRRALQVDPLHADAHNHLGIQALDRGRLVVAEEHFRTAIEGGERFLERDGNKIPWGNIHNRPHMRGMYNLALVFRQRGDFAGALKLHEKLLRMNPNDNQGARFLAGEEYHRIGNTQKAIAAYRKGLDDPGCAFGLALVLLESKANATEVGTALLIAFASNRYLAPMLLGEKWELLEGFHGSNVAEPEWAADLVNEVRDLWARVPRSAETLRFWWRAGPVQAWRREMDELMVALKGVRAGEERSRIVERLYSLRGTAAIARVVATALAAS